MSETNYTSKPYAMGDRPADLMKPDGHGHSAENTASSGLPSAIMEDFGDTPGGQVARAARMQRNVLSSMQESKVAPNTLQIIGAAMVGGVVGAAIGGVADLVVHKLPFLPDPLKEVVSHTMLTAGMIAGIHAGEKILAPKHVNTISDKTQQLIDQSDNQTAKAYLEVLSIEKAANNVAPFNRVSSQEKGERLEAPQQMQIAGIS